MTEPLPMPEIDPGWDVRDVDGELVGLILEVSPSYILIEQGRFFPDDVYLPVDAIAGVEPGLVTLNVSGEAALAAGWHAGPPVGVGAFSTEALAPGIMLGGQVEELGTTLDDAATGAGAPVFRPAEIAYLERQTIGRLATVDAAGMPHVVPVTFRLNRDFETIDIGGPGFAASKKYADVSATGRVAFVVDDLDEDRVPRGIELRGRGELLAEGGRSLDELFDDDLLRVFPEHIAQWGLGTE